MDLPWLQHLNLLLTRTSGALDQNNTMRSRMVDEVKHTLLCLARRRGQFGGRQIVTSEHLTKAVQYFDVRLVVADMDFDEKNDTGNPRINFFQRYYDGYSSDNESYASEDPQNSSSDQSGSSGSTSTTKTGSQNIAASVNATIPAKRKA